MTAGDSLGASVQACLAYGNAVAAAFDATIRQMAFAAVVRTFCVEVAPRNAAMAASNPHFVLPCPAHATPQHHAERRVWKGRLG